MLEAQPKRLSALTLTLLLLLAANLPLLAQPGEENPFAKTTQACIEPDGLPYEKTCSDGKKKVCIKVKNNSSRPQVVKHTMTPHKVGIHGRVAQTATSGSTAIRGGQTGEICAEKPTAPGTYCFRWDLENFDKQKDESYSRWLNNIKIASLAGESHSGNFEVGGSGLVAAAGINLDPEVATAPAGWDLELSTYYVAAADFPETVDWTLTVPEDATDGEEVTITVSGYDQDTGDLVGTVDFITTVGPQPVEPPRPIHGSEPGATLSPVASPPEPGTTLERPDRPLQPKLGLLGEDWGSQEKEIPVAGTVFLIAWDDNWAYYDPHMDLRFEVLGPRGWTLIGDQDDRPHIGDSGMALVKWRTGELAAGTYQVRVIMDNGAGPASAERTFLVRTHPVAKARMLESEAPIGRYDGSDSYDPDGEIVEWRWDFSDGTVAYGREVEVVHTGDDPMIRATLTVTDTDGLEATEIIFCDIEVCECTTEEFCGCTDMDVKTDGPATLPFIGTKPGDCKLGPYINPNPPVGGVPFEIRSNFEVHATLCPGSDPTLCDYGQWANHSLKIANRCFDPTGHPYGGPTMGSDNYDAPSTYLKTDGGTIRWSDGPGSTGHTGHIAISGLLWQAQFFAMVTGDKATCWCEWEVVFEILANGTVKTPPVVTKENCS